MTNTPQVILHVSSELFGRMEARAVADRFDLHEWVLRAVINELLRSETEITTERRARAAIAVLSFPPSARPTNERKPHASYP